MIKANYEFIHLGFMSQAFFFFFFKLGPNDNNEQPCLQQPGALAILKICTVTLLSVTGFIQTPDQTKVRSGKDTG